MRYVLRRWRGRRAEQGGYVAIVVAMLTATVFMGCAAIADDTSNWYAKMRDMQLAADAAALAGVPYLPNDMTDASALAQTVAARNGFTNGVNGVTVAVGVGDRPTQLTVTITAKYPNTFGQVIGFKNKTLTRTATADYQGPSPMGSPCNTFGNEPSSGGGTSSVTPTGTALASTGRYANCTSNPSFWSTIEGPQTDKVQGDRYQTSVCASNDAENCTGNKNAEFANNGYFMVVKVQPTMVNQPIKIQLYDPAYVGNAHDCAGLPTSGLSSGMNPWVGSDAAQRYSQTGTSSTGAPFCTGDYQPGSTSSNLMTTSFAMRQQTDTQNPMQGAIISGCVKQYTGQLTVPTAAQLTKTNSKYNDQLAQVFHNWTQLCQFTPTRAGDYYLQIQSDVAPGGSSSTNTNGNAAIIYSGNSNVGSASLTPTLTGAGDNSFAVRAVTPTGLENGVSVSGFSSMAIFANATGASSTFNLIRVAPGAAGNFVQFSFFDIGDASTSGTVTITPPSDATGTIKTKPFPKGCAAKGGNAGTGATTSETSCQVTITNAKNNGAVETMTIPIPTDYNCNYASMGGCWYQVTVKFASGSTVNDITTWDASVEGDPVRLIK